MSQQFTPQEYGEINIFIEKLMQRRNMPVQHTIPAATGKPLTLPRYATPTRTDMAIVIVYFNPNFSVRLMQNFLLTRHMILQASIPLFVGELAFDETPFLLTDAAVQVRTTNYMVYKENLVKAVETKIPATYTKLCVLDADILFEQHDWYDTVSATLDTASVCKPFTTTKYIGVNFREEATTEGHHAIAYQRTWASNITDQTVIGSSNLLLESPPSSRIVAFYKDALSLPSLPAPTTCPLTIYHLFHGSLKNRNPDSPTVALQVAFHRLGVSKLHEVLDRRDDGILQWKPEAKPLLNSVMQKYFVGRKDDEAGTSSSHKFYPVPYATPTNQDMAVLIVFFNPNPYTRIVQNVLMVKQFMDAAKIPYYIAEMAFEDRPFLFNKEPNILQFRSNSYMFYKENLITSAEPLIPAQFTKLCLMDADIMFDTPNWYSVVSNTLNRVVVSQPFKRAVWLNPNYTVESVRTNCIDAPSTSIINYREEHTGFVWAFDRAWFKACRFIDVSVVSSSGDSLLHDMIKAPRKSACTPFYEKYFDIKLTTDKLSYESCSLSVYHLNHGSIHNRQYRSMVELVEEKLKEMKVASAASLIVRRADNILEWDPKYRSQMNKMMQTYFEKRREDEV